MPDPVAYGVSLLPPLSITAHHIWGVAIPFCGCVYSCDLVRHCGRRIYALAGPHFGGGCRWSDGPPVAVDSSCRKNLPTRRGSHVVALQERFVLRDALVGFASSSVLRVAVRPRCSVRLRGSISLSCVKFCSTAKSSAARACNSRPHADRRGCVLNGALFRGRPFVECIPGPIQQKELKRSAWPRAERARVFACWLHTWTSFPVACPRYEAPCGDRLRALMNNPRILLLDESPSARWTRSQRVWCRNSCLRFMTRRRRRFFSSLTMSKKRYSSLTRSW